MKLWKRYSPFLLVYGAIFLLSSRPASDFPHIVPDYIPHFLEYMLLAFFFARAVGRSAFPSLIGQSVILLLLALLDEIHQYFVPTRFFEFSDLLTDYLGSWAGLLAWRYFELGKEKKTEAANKQN